MHPLARLRHVLARRPWLYWLGVGVLAAGRSALVAVRAAASVDEARQRWGTTREVAVATLPTSPPAIRSPAATELRSRPGADGPGRGASPRSSTVRRARQHVAVGEILVGARSRRVRRAAGADPARLVGGRRRRSRFRSGAAVGDRRRGGQRRRRRRPTTAIVVGQRDDAVLVAVPDDDAPAVAAASVGRRRQPAAAAMTASAPTGGQDHEHDDRRAPPGRSRTA